MQKYLNASGQSGIVSFAIATEHIDVQFADGAVYRYDKTKPGSPQLEKLKQLAITGRGLNSYISSVVKKNYAAKLK